MSHSQLYKLAMPRLYGAKLCINARFPGHKAMYGVVRVWGREGRAWGVLYIVRVWGQEGRAWGVLYIVRIRG